jgi:predicted methyltransferase
LLCGCAENTPAAQAPAAASAPAQAPALPAAPPVAAQPSANYAAIVDAADRSPEDRALDNGRHPKELLELLGLTPGMKCAEIGAGGGYTTELLARAVGPTGVVYGQNSKLILERFAEAPWSARLAKPVMKNVVRVDRDFDDPLPPEAHDLDVVVNVLFYHDTVWQKVDRVRMNQAIFKALRSGGHYVLLDHSGRPGTQATETQSLHRIEEKFLQDEVSQAGFRLLKSSDVWKNPADTRDWSASPRTAGERRGTSDRFALVFERP